VAASPAGGIAARATVVSAEAKAQRPAARFGPPSAKAPEARRPEARAPEVRTPERKVAPPIERPAPATRRADANDASPPGRPSLFERMTGTGRARRSGFDGETPPARTESRTPKSAEAKPNGQQTSGPKARLRNDLPPPTSAAPKLGTDASRTSTQASAAAVAKSPEPFLDGFSPSNRAPGGTEDPLDIPAFLRRQAN
jgi:hypothetical protein